jgi:hypothetical protein
VCKEESTHFSVEALQCLQLQAPHHHGFINTLTLPLVCMYVCLLPCVCSGWLPGA